MAGMVGRQAVPETYSPGYIKRVLEALGIKGIHESGDQLNMLCPYHSDRTPSFTVSTKTGLFFCFQPACGKTGDINQLVREYGNFNDYEALRFMSRCKPGEDDQLISTLETLLAEESDFEPFDSNKINALHESLSDRAVEYMEGRGIERNILDKFKVGYSEKKDMVTLPCYSHNNVPVGIIGRSIEGKRFQYSTGMPIGKVWFNLNLARRRSSTAIITESSFDALRVHQAGYPNVIAALGGTVSKYKMDILNKYFDKVVIMTDNDKIKHYEGCRNVKCRTGGVCLGHNPGRELGGKIADQFSREVMWAVQDSQVVYPNGAKDAGDLTDSEIRMVIENSVPDFEYRQRL